MGDSASDVGDDAGRRRARMVRRQLAARGISDERVLEAMGAIPRELFVDAEWQDEAYADRALPIGLGQTISQPWIVAAIAQALELQAADRVLEIGTGSGYSTAVLARLGGPVVSIERYQQLAERARTALDRLGVDDVEVRVGDGSGGHPPRAPYDAIAVHATAPAVPPALLDQLGPAGRIVLPLRSGEADELVRLRRPTDPEGPWQRELISPARFVPLVGEQGFAAG